MIYQLSKDEIWFPEPELADKDGLLAIGGDLSVNRLLLAYKHGIFPWYSDETPILWYSPHERFVLFSQRIKISPTMRKLLKSERFRITFDQDFEGVIHACANIPRRDNPGTWITNDMQKAYIKLNRLGHAHSVEVWENNALVGGLYGVAINNVFCGESMFSKVSNASKAALIWLCQTDNYSMIDCQLPTRHLESMGAGPVSRNDYFKFLRSE